MKVNVVSSVGLGKKSKRTKKHLYVCCDVGTELENKHYTQTKKGRVYSLEDFEKNPPMEEINKLIDFCEKHEIEVLDIGVSNFPYESHAFIIAEEIRPTGLPFELKTQSSYGTVREFRNQRCFKRWLNMTNINSSKHFRIEYLNFLDTEDIADEVGIQKDDL